MIAAALLLIQKAIEFNQVFDFHFGSEHAGSVSLLKINGQAIALIVPECLMVDRQGAFLLQHVLALRAVTLAGEDQSCLHRSADFFPGAPGEFQIQARPGYRTAALDRTIRLQCDLQGGCVSRPARLAAEASPRQAGLFLASHNQEEHREQVREEPWSSVHAVGIARKGTGGNQKFPRGSLPAISCATISGRATL